MPNVQDTFSRVTASGWGSADTGEVWSVLGTASHYSTSGGLGRQSHPAVNVLHQGQLAISYPDIDVTLVHGGVSAIPTGGNFEVSILGRYVDANNYVDFRIFRTTTNVTCAVRQFVAGVETATGFPAVTGVLNNSDISMRLQVVGSTLRGKAWQRGTTEPAAWNVTMTTTHLTSGQVGLRSYLDAAVTNALPVEFTFDDLSVQVTAFTTATWELPFPEPTDRFCDGWMFTQALAERVDEILDDFDADLAFVEKPPFARISITDPYDLANGGRLVFTDVDLDTANLVDLAHDPSGIFVDTDAALGQWMVGGYLRHISSNTVGARGQLQFWKANTGVVQSGVRDQGVGVQPRVATSGFVRVASPQPNDSIYANYTLSSAVTTISVQEQYMFAWRVSD